MGVRYMNEDQIPDIKRNPWIDNFFRPVLITTMIMSFNVSLVNFVRLLNPEWRSWYFLAGMLLTTVEAIYSFRVLRQWRSRGISLFRYRMAEIVMLVLLLKGLSWGASSFDYILAELQRLWLDPLSFLNIEFYMLLTLAFLSWVAATQTITDFEALYDPYTFRTDNILPLSDLAARFYWGGVGLVLISGITHWVSRYGAASLTDLQRPSLGGIIVNVLLYFMLGLVLLSQANLTRLMIRWRVQKIEVAPTVLKQWGKYALIFLFVITVIVFFLPTSYTLGFLASASVLIQYLLSLIVFLVQFLFFLISIPIAWLLSFFQSTPVETSGQAAARPILPLFPNDPAEGNAVPWLEALQSLAFWLLILAIVAYFVRVYLIDHPELLDALKKFRLFRLILALIGQLWRQMLGLAQVGLDLIPSKIGRLENEGPGPREAGQSWLRLGQRSPRQRILYYYLNIIKRVGDQGTVRQRSQTPHEFEAILRQTIPEADQEVGGLTEAFIQVRYGQAKVSKEKVAFVKQLWLYLKKRLRAVIRARAG